MKIVQPLIFLAFANDQQSPLASLTQESDDIYSLLTDGASNQYYQLHRDPATTIKKISDFLSKFKDRVHIFHYGGHAESEKLILEDQEADAGGIARLLAQQKNLKLVFLNGCSTKGQVERLLDLGVSNVIATSAPVNDTKAGQFSRQFYQALANQHSIGEAFEMAAGSLQSGGEEAIQVYRSIKLRESEGDTGLPWGLYTRDASGETLQYKLPTKSFKEIIIRGATDRYNVSRVPVNEHLTQVLFESLADYNDELEFLQFQAQKGKKVDIRRVRLAIMNCLPAPIGEQVRKLFAADPEVQEAGLDRISVERLEQLVKTYNTFIELMAYSMLAQLWDWKHEHQDQPVSEALLAKIKAFFQQDETSLRTYNFVELIRTIREFFDEQQVPYFIMELGELRRSFEEEESFAAGIQFMEAMKMELYGRNDKIAADEIESFCVQAEEHLSAIIRHFGFVAKYKLTTIKNIDLIKRRHTKPEYRHFLVSLDTVTAGYLDQNETFNYFTDNNSVLFLRPEGEEDTGLYLNLSPFIIDENAFTGDDKSKLFFFQFCDRPSNSYHYKFAYINEDRLVVSQQKFPEIHEQFEAFSQTIFDKSLQQL